MAPRISRLFALTDKAEEVAAERDNSTTDQSSPPPSYSDADRDNVLDPPDLTAGFSKLDLRETTKDGFPTPDQCIAHLKLLECFYRLRQRIGSSDGLFGINNSVVTAAGVADDQQTDQLLSKLAEKRWAIYVARAVDRFETWLNATLSGAKMASMDVLRAMGEKGELCTPSAFDSNIKFTRETLPPVDVLMVWHAYMLNPRAYLEDRLRSGTMRLWHTPMPWRPVADCIDSDNFVYFPGEDAETHYSQLTREPWENLAGPDLRTIACPSCSKDCAVAWTTCYKNATRQKSSTFSSLELNVDSLLSSGTGYCDKDFIASCNACGTQITHERLRASKFCADIRSLRDANVPMSGTLLGLTGIPWRVGTHPDTTTKDIMQGPNMLLASDLGLKILTKRNMEDIKQEIEAAVKDRAYIRKAMALTGGQRFTLRRNERIGIRKMMSRYWENSSPFALDLVGAVIRQGSFVEKMHNIDWLHSPALPSTMSRLLVKYERFVDIMADRLHMAVPTLDVDLAWHTHQLSPSEYAQYTIERTARFIDHDDKIAETKLNDAFVWTSKTYQRIHGVPYSECTCWYCEAVRESHTSVASRLFRTPTYKANDKLHAVDSDPRKSVHISAHNAVRPTDDSKKYQASADSKAKELDRAYRKACERAKKNGKKEPRRDDYYYSDAYGYPVWIPAYSPYVGGMGYTPLYYPVNPGCMAVGAGMAGNCAAGTCGGAVAAGSCGGAGGACASGGCAGGGAGGGCGGGGGGGGCGGGGGGGGCGGGGGGC